MIAENSGSVAISTVYSAAWLAAAQIKVGVLGICELPLAGDCVKTVPAGWSVTVRLIVCSAVSPADAVDAETAAPVRWCVRPRVAAVALAEAAAPDSPRPTFIDAAVVDADTAEPVSRVACVAVRAAVALLAETAAPVRCL